MNIGSSSQNPRHAMERNQAVILKGLESEESDARHSVHDSTGSRRSRTGSRRLYQIQEAVFRQENLNKASPKDEYPMPMADMLVDGATHNQMLSFMDGNAGKIQPFSSLLRLKQEQMFKWEEQHQQAFEEIKHYLSNSPVLSPPKKGRPLKLYVGTVLVQDNKEGKEHAVYYLS
ncbi:hypothetical protein L3X38_040682 [Prunus dulcis]|uniref:Reverse transcriptase/retrotransposon-derived protein RNase H-like domain-containing protein n=1 Tax=Prunus dulcis TaxID=3755 RepID=A0AAD4VAP8_PRUDU|nr:hypothetical protein L3X38_040682 [Prunus dulcis]